MAQYQQKPSFGESFLNALATGLANYTVERQRSKDQQAANATTALNFSMQQQKQQMENQRIQAGILESLANAQRIRNEMSMTPRERMDLLHQQEMEKQQKEYELKQANEIAALDYAIKHGVTTSGNTPSGSSTNPAKSFINPTLSLIKTNAGIKARNATAEAKYQKDRAAATEWGLPMPAVPVPQDTVNISNVLYPMMHTLGVDSSNIPYFLNALQGAAAPQQAPSVDSTIVDWALRNISDWSALDEQTKQMVINKRKSELGLQ